jgi:hypothetical protein
MSNAIFYRSALTRPLSPPERRLIESLLSRAERIESLAALLPDQIGANRERREGGPVVLSKSEKRTIRSFERDAQKAAAEMPSIVAGIPSVIALLRTALAAEGNALQLDRVVYTGGHPEDESLARPLLELRQANIAELEQFLSKSRRSGRSSA